MKNAATEMLREVERPNLEAMVKEYAEIIAREKAKPGDRERLEEIMGALGVSREDLAADLRAVAKGREYRQLIEANEETEEQRTARANRIDGLMAEIAAMSQKLEDLRREKNNLWGEGDSKRNSQGIYQRELWNVEKAHPRAFGKLPPKPAAAAAAQVNRIHRVG